MPIQHCHFCNYTGKPVHVHGHYQCAVCHTNILPCCDGDNCETNQLLAGTTTAEVKSMAIPGPKNRIDATCTAVELSVARMLLVVI